VQPRMLSGQARPRRRFPENPLEPGSCLPRRSAAKAGGTRRQRVEDKAVNQAGPQPEMILPQPVITAFLGVITKAFVLKCGIPLSSVDAFTYNPKRPKTEKENEMAKSQERNWLIPIRAERRVSRERAAQRAASPRKPANA
jgi:hypothetical protein